MAGGLEAAFVGMALAEREAPGVEDHSGSLRYARQSVMALRCNLARQLTGLSYRDFAMRAAESQLLQWFLGTGEVDRVKPPSKSQLERYDKWLSAGTLLAFNQQVIRAAKAGQSTPGSLGLDTAIDLTEIFFDATCLKTNIHYPVDWVLLRDATRTLMKATQLIRQAGLKNRMPEAPLDFLRRMNQLTMAMSAASRQADGKRARKKTLRAMKTLQAKVTAHARAHREVLLAAMAANPRPAPELSAAQAQQILRRIDQVLQQLPAAIAQAHERIIGERQVPNREKILSLYERETQIQIRGKAGARIEYGNKLWLGETQEGLIADYRLESGTQAEVKLLGPALKRLQAAGLKPERAWGDRGLHSAANERRLAKAGIKSGLCPRAPTELKIRLENDPEYGPGLRRRGNTEARIAILKNRFLGSPCMAKGITNREQALGWAVLTHNLWVLARREVAAKEKRAQEKAA